VPIKVQVERSIWRKQTVYERKALIQEIKIFIQIVPGIMIAVSQLPFFGFPGVFPTAYACIEFSICEKRRVCIDKVNTAFIFRQ
jgi:hypothetical protein